MLLEPESVEESVARLLLFPRECYEKVEAFNCGTGRNFGLV